MRVNREVGDGEMTMVFPEARAFRLQNGQNIP
jgi:hypothetical protein